MSTATADIIPADPRTELPRWQPAPFVGAPKVVELSPMLVNVLDSLCEGGKSNKEIGADWGVAEDTVKTHLKRLYAKIGARDRVHAVTLVFSGAVDVRCKHHRYPAWSSGAEGDDL